MNHMYVSLEVLTPVHVFSGETMDPMSYVMAQEKDKVFCHIIDTTTWLEDQPDKGFWADFFSKSKIQVIRQRIAQEVDPKIYGLNSCQVKAPELYKEHFSALSDLQSNKTLEISPHIRSGANQAAILPGSSIKGAIRTAVIDFFGSKVQSSAETPQI